MEELLHYTWKHKLFPPHKLVTDKGLKLEIIDTGLPNYNAGPDFFNAKIKIDNILWVGNVEIHNSSADWYKHGHNTDPVYDSVILHVVGKIEKETLCSNGRIIPQLQLECPEHVIKNFHELANSNRYPACHKIIRDLPGMLVHSWMNSLYLERLCQKSQDIYARLRKKENNWEETIFVTIARNFGFGINGEAFEVWANTIPLKAVMKQQDSLMQIEALFFGQAGLLENNEDDEYYSSLRKEYMFLRNKYSLKPINPSIWKLLRLRPNNFPYIRLSQLAVLYHNCHFLLSRIIDADNIVKMRNLLKFGATDYWNTHYTFGKKTDARPKSISKSSADLLIINSIVPILYSYGKHRSDETLCERAIDMLEEIKPEYNYITRIWDECGIKADNAVDSQALIQLKKEYCDKKKCLYCRFGYVYMKRVNG